MVDDRDLDLIDDPYRRCDGCDQTVHEDHGHSCAECDQWICHACWEAAEFHQHVTVRQWFRMQRRSHYHGGYWRTFSDIDRLVTKILAGQPVDLVETVGPVKLIFGREEWERYEHAMTLVKVRLELAMREIEAELQRRAAITAAADSVRAEVEAWPRILADPQDYWRGLS